MKILVVGGGGREHAITWKLAQSSHKPELYCLPGNAGIAQIATCVPGNVNDNCSIVKYAKENAFDLVVVAPDDPLSHGLVDDLNLAGVRAFGPVQKAAQLESSKAFSKELMKKYGIPTADYEIFTDKESAIEYLSRPQQTFPAVIKASGLALGKGVIIAPDHSQACEAVTDMMENNVFGDAGSKIVIEEFLTGPEVTVLAFCDGERVVPMVSSQDHKRAFDGDKGPNTGGMGAFSPSPNYTPEVAQRCMDEIFLPTVSALKAEGIDYRGVIYFGLMITPEGPKVIEYNSRFGDPETQCVLPRLKSDLVDIFNACIDGNLDSVSIEWEDEAACCIVIASGGYPGKYAKGYPISGIEEASSKDAVVFHAGTAAYKGEGPYKYVNNGGRVLGVTSRGETVKAAAAKAYVAAECISWEGSFMRKDIGGIER